MSTSSGLGIVDACAMIFSWSEMAFLMRNHIYCAHTLSLAKQTSLCSGVGYVIYDLMCSIADEYVDFKRRVH